MNLFYKNFDIEDWENIVLTIPYMYKNYDFVYSLSENIHTYVLPTFIEIY